MNEAMAEILITCKTCGAAMPEDKFYRNDRNKSGRFSDCKRCYLDARKTPGAQPGRKRTNIRPGFSRCLGCRKVLPNSSYYLRHDRGPRLVPASYCKDCENAKRRDRNQREKRQHPEKVLERQDKKNARRRRNRRQAMASRRRELKEGIALLRSLGWTTTRICREAPCAFDAVGRWENGTVKRPRPTSVAKIWDLISRHIADSQQPYLPPRRKDLQCQVTARLTIGSQSLPILGIGLRLTESFVVRVGASCVQCLKKAGASTSLLHFRGDPESSSSTALC